VTANQRRGVGRARESRGRIFLGMLMALGGVGWLSVLSPYNLAAGTLAKMSVFMWLLVAGLNAQRWNALASARHASPP
jgi:hypothetical protein